MERAAGDPERLALALDELNRLFEELTDTSASRAGGETYAGRTLVYEDCLRDGTVHLGQELIARISRPLQTVLQSASWFCWEIGRRYNREFRARFDELAGDSGEVRFLDFQASVVSLFPGPGAGKGIVHDVSAELQRRWKDIAAGEDAATRVLDLDDVERKVAEQFAAPGPGWPSARNQSPDILLSAASTEAINRGEFFAVLGEVHVGHNTVGTPDNSYEHPAPETLAAGREAELPVGITPTWNEPIRVMLYSLCERDYEYETGKGRSHRPREKVLSAASCVVFLKGDELYVRSSEGGPEFHILAFMEQHLIAESYSEFNMLASSEAHRPRIVLGDLVLQRESWRFDGAEIPGASESDRVQAFGQVRRWAKGEGLPRFIFVKTETETKPFFVDLDSVVLVANFLRHAQEGGRVSISEMLPDFDHAWLSDPEGRRYCSELRMCYVEPTSFSPSLLRGEQRATAPTHQGTDE